MVYGTSTERRVAVTKSSLDSWPNVFTFYSMKNVDLLGRSQGSGTVLGSRKTVMNKINKQDALMRFIWKDNRDSVSNQENIFVAFKKDKSRDVAQTLYHSLQVLMIWLLPISPSSFLTMSILHSAPASMK